MQCTQISKSPTNADNVLPPTRQARATAVWVPPFEDALSHVSVQERSAVHVWCEQARVAHRRVVLKGSVGGTLSCRLMRSLCDEI
jgi:hypothetical protein